MVDPFTAGTLAVFHWYRSLTENEIRNRNEDRMSCWREMLEVTRWTEEEWEWRESCKMWCESLGDDDELSVVSPVETEYLLKSDELGGVNNCDKISETRWIKDLVTSVSRSVRMNLSACVTQLLRLAVSVSFHSRYLHTHSASLLSYSLSHPAWLFFPVPYLILTHLSYNSIFTKDSCEPADPHLFCMMLFEDTLQLSLHSRRQGCT